MPHIRPGLLRETRGAPQKATRGNRVQERLAGASTMGTGEGAGDEMPRGRPPRVLRTERKSPGCMGAGPVLSLGEPHSLLQPPGLMDSPSAVGPSPKTRVDLDM
jgi:hypothetical protein